MIIGAWLPSNTNVKLKTMIEEYDIPKKRVKIAGEWSTWDVIISTLSPEDIFHSCFGQLRWAGRDFLKLVLPVQEALPKHIYFLYYANDEPFTASSNTRSSSSTIAILTRC